MRNAMLSTIIVLCGAGYLRADLVTNGSFETGDLTGWTTSFWGVVKGVEPPILNGAEDGTYVAESTTGGLIQNLTTVSAYSYTLSFYYDIGACVVLHGTCVDNPRDDLTVLWGSTTVFDTGLLVGNSATDPGWVHESITVVASSSSTALDFSVTTDNVLPLYIDNVSVTANTTTAVPEPSSIMLLITGLGVLALISTDAVTALRSSAYPKS